MKKVLLTFLFLLMMGSTKADTLDSIYLAVRSDVKGNVDKVNHLIAQLDAQGWADSLYVFNSRDRQERIQATLDLYMAYSCYDRGMYANAIELSKNVIELCDILGDMEMKSDALAHLSTTLFRAGKLDQAVAYTIQGLHLDSTLNDMSRLSSSFNNIAAFTLASGHNKDAEHYILKAISIEESLNNPQKLSIRYGVASEVYNNLKDYSKALDYISKAYELDRKEGNVIGAARRQSQMADIYLSQKDYPAAERLYDSAIATLREKKETSSLVISLKQIGRLYGETGRWDRCLNVLQECDSLVRKMDYDYQLIQITKLMAEAYKHKSQWQEVARCYEEALSMREEMYNEQFEQMSADYNTRYQWMEMEKQELERKQEHSGWLSSLHMVLILVLVLLVVVLLFGYQRSRKRLTLALAQAQRVESADNSVTADNVASADHADHADDHADHADDHADHADDHAVQPEASSVPEASSASTKEDNIIWYTVREKMKGISSVDDDMLFRFRRIVLENIESADIELIRSRLALSRDGLNAFTVRTTGLNPKNLLQHCKMEYAAKLLLTTNRTVNDIATACGYYDNSYFGRVFLRTYGVTPGTFRRNKGVSQ